MMFMWKCLKIATKMPWFNDSLKGRYKCTNHYTSVFGHVERDTQTVIDSISHDGSIGMVYLPT